MLKLRKKSLPYVRNKLFILFSIIYCLDDSDEFDNEETIRRTVPKSSSGSIMRQASISSTKCSVKKYSKDFRREIDEFDIEAANEGRTFIRKGKFERHFLKQLDYMF